MKKIVACEGCHKNPAEVRLCQIRVMNFQVFNGQCPREKEPLKEKKKAKTK